MGTTSALNDPDIGTTSKAGFIDGTSLDIGSFVPGALVILNEEGITGTSSVTEWTNSSKVGDSNYDLDTVVGTGANLKPHPSDSMVLYGASGDYASTPDSVAASITGDIDIRVRANPDDWTPAALHYLCGKFAAGQRAYLFGLNVAGALRMQASTDGSTLDVDESSTAQIGFANGTTNWVRVTVDVDNGSSGHDINFYTSDEPVEDSANVITWTQLGATVTTAGVISFADTTAPVEIGSANAGTANNFSGSILRGQIYNGIDGTLAVDFNAADYVNKTSDTTFPSTNTGEVWTLNNNVFIQNTGQKIADNIGSVGLEPTTGQDFSSFTAMFVARFKDSTPAADQFLFDSKFDAAKSVRLFSDFSNSNKWTLDAGGTPIALTEAYDNDFHVFGIRYESGVATLTVSGVGTVSGNPGTEVWDYQTLMADLAAANSGPLAVGTQYVYNRVLKDSEYQSQENWLINEYNL